MNEEKVEYTPPAPEPTLWEKFCDLKKGVRPDVAIWLIGFSAVLGFIAGQLSK